MTVNLADVVRVARTCVHTPFAHLGRMKDVALDCAGLVIVVARELGLVAPDFDVTAYPRSPDGSSLLAECDKFMDRIPMWQLGPGHVLVLRFNEDPQHLGIIGDYMFGDDCTLIHAYGRPGGGGRVEERRLDRRSRIMKPVQAYALRGVE